MEVENKVEDMVAAEKERVAQIQKIVKCTNLDSGVEARFIREGISADKAREAAWEIAVARSDAFNIQSQHPDNNLAYRDGRIIEVGETSHEKFQRGASAWLFERMGNGSPVQKAIDAKVRGFERLETNGGEFRGLSLFDLARESLEQRGVRTRGWNKTRIVGEALTFRSGGQNTTSDFGVLLENVLFKVLLGQYLTTPDTWSRFCKTDTVQDFRASNRYRLGSFGTLDSVPEGAEFKNKSIPDGLKFSVSAQTKGNIIAISRQAIINDDMGALSSAAAMLGRAAKLSIEMDVYSLLNAQSGLGPDMDDGHPFFYSARGNVNGSGSALGVDGLDADRVLMAKQKDPSDNEVLDLKPSVLLVNVGLGGEARVINGARYDVTDSAAFEKPNKVFGLFREVVDTARLTDAKRRYLFADPGVCPAITVAFLEGQGQAPFLEQQLGWRVDGTEWKCRLDYGVQMTDPRGAVTNAGQ